MNDSILRSLQRAQELLRGKETSPETVSAADSVPYLIVGLGNPGREYSKHRHNIGFMVVDALASAVGISFGRVQMKAIVANGGWEGHKLILAKPQTYMNLSGDAAAALVRFYKVPQDRFLVIYDDLDLPFGALRLRPDGGPGGQKGVASVISRLGTQKFGRLRVGIGRPPGQMDPSAFLLQDFSSKELELMAPVIDRAVQAVQTFIRSGLDTAMNQYNGTNPS